MKILILFFTLLANLVSAQQDPLVTTFWNNYAVFNPATSGLEFKHQAALTYRNQWVGVTGAPESLFANYGTLLGKNHGIGINYTYETIGFTEAQFLHLNYNYQFKIDDDRKIALGISPGLSHIKYTGYITPPTTTPDPSLPVTTTNIDFNGGIAYKGKSIYTGVGVTHFVELLRYKSSPGAYSQAPHMYVHFRNELSVNRKHKLYLEGIFRTDFAINSFELNARTALKRLMFGVGYRYRESFMLFASWDFKEKYRLGYSYDLPQFNSPLSSISSGSHEITVGLKIPHKPSSRVIITPNF